MEHPSDYQIRAILEIVEKLRDATKSLTTPIEAKPGVTPILEDIKLLGDRAWLLSEGYKPLADQIEASEEWEKALSEIAAISALALSYLQSPRR